MTHLLNHDAKQAEMDNMLLTETLPRFVDEASRVWSTGCTQLPRFVASGS
jgi:hypothetical protein